MIHHWSPHKPLVFPLRMDSTTSCGSWVTRRALLPPWKSTKAWRRIVSDQSMAFMRMNGRSWVYKVSWMTCPMSRPWSMANDRQADHMVALQTLSTRWLGVCREVGHGRSLHTKKDINYAMEMSFPSSNLARRTARRGAQKGSRAAARVALMCPPAGHATRVLAHSFFWLGCELRVR